MSTRTHPDYPKRLNLDNDNYYRYVPFYESKELEKNKGIWADDSNISKEELLKREMWVNNKLITLKEANICFDSNDKPLTPLKTGIRGRGVLGRYGPNHAADPIITRENPEKAGDIQFVAALRNDVNEWCIPGGMVDPGEDVSKTLEREFIEEVAQNNPKELIQELFKDGTIVFTGGTFGDPRTTDNAWIETVVKHFHINKDLSEKLILTPQLSENSKVKWISCDSENLYGDHEKFVKLAKENALKIIQQEKEDVNNNDLDTEGNIDFPGLSAHSNEVKNIKEMVRILIVFLFIFGIFISIENLFYLKNVINRISIIESELNYLIQYKCSS